MLLPDTYANFMQKFYNTLELQKTVMIISIHKFKTMNRSDPSSGILGSVPEYGRLTRESGPCRLRVKAHENLHYCFEE